MFSLVLVCAGEGSRFGGTYHKVLHPLNGMPIFMHSVLLFEKYCDDIIIVAHPLDIDLIKSYTNHKIILGGKNRAESVHNGVLAAKNTKIMVHDGARPLLKSEDLELLLEHFSINRCAYLAQEVRNTLHFKEKHDFVLNRNDLVEALTPQCFYKDDYLSLYEKSSVNMDAITDEIMLFEKYSDINPKPVIIKNTNKKITTKEDLIVIEDYRIGQSWDVHKLVLGRKLILGGISIPFEKGLLGHSDADVLLHAIAESLLGALALGDLGKFYPDTDPRNKDLNSAVLLKEIYQKIIDLNYEVVNIDSMIYAERPKLADYILQMRKNIAQILQIDISQISIKATTYEKLGEIGSGEAIAAEGCVLLKKRG